MWNLKKISATILMLSIYPYGTYANIQDGSCESRVQGTTIRQQIIKDMYTASGGKNSVFSMFSLDSVMTLVGGGFRQDISELLTTKLLENSLQSFYAIMKQAKHISPDVTFSSADAVWLAEGMELLPGYLSYMKDMGLPSSRSLDVSQPAQSAAEINQWSNDATKGLVPKIIDPSLINNSTFAILTNSVYFKAPWKFQFDPSKTKSAKFQTVSGNNQVQIMVPTMHKYATSLDVAYSPSATNEDETIATLRLPYKDARYAMYVSFHAKNINEWDHAISVDATKPMEPLIDFANSPQVFAQKFRSKKFSSFAMPKFRVESKFENVKSIFINNGLQALFNTGVLSQLTSRPDAFIAFIVHAAQFVCDEFGGEGGASSAVGLGLEGVMQHRDLQLDGPFMFAVRDHQTEQTIFQGIIRNPQ